MATMGSRSQQSFRDRLNEENKYWDLVADAGEFDIEHLMEMQPPSCLLHCISNNFRTDVVHYARFGLHRYNMIKGTNLQLSCIEKFNYRSSVPSMDYYITLVVKDPAAGGSPVTFQTRVIAEGFGSMNVTCYFTRPKPEQQEYPGIRHRMIIEPVDDFYNVGLLEWPSSENAFYDKKRFYVVRKSEVRKNDWIRLYLEIAFLHTNIRLKNPNLSKLVILKVAVETKENVEQPSERLKAMNAIFYIKYKYYPNFKGRDLKVRCHNPPRDRIAILARTMDKNSGLFTLAFKSGRYANTFL